MTRTPNEVAHSSNVADLEGGVTLRMHETREQLPLKGPVAHAWHRTDGSPWINLYQTSSGSLLRLPGLGDFIIDHSGHIIDAWPTTGLDNTACHQLCLNNILPMALSRQGKLVLHASAIDAGGWAIVFVGLSGRGKSTLATSFAADGHPLIVDDGLTVEPRNGGYLAMPGEHAVRLWRDSARHFTADDAMPAATLSYIEKQWIPAGSKLQFSREPVPIRAVFLLGDNQQPTVTIQPLRPADAAMALIQYSFLLDVGDPRRHAAQMLHAAALTASSRIARLDYPRDYAQLPQIRQAIVAHAS